LRSPLSVTVRRPVKKLLNPGTATKAT